MGWTQNDTSPTGVFTCSSDTPPVVNLTGATVVLHCTRDDGTTFTRTAGGNGLTVTSVTAPATVSYTPQIGDLPVAGVYRFELQVTFASGAIQTFPYTRTYVGPELG